ncbi:hypothetical protein BDV30DRAFT_203930 [Aspergillus minisclerotigenes]|uniref:Uncharacterized protein n=1 Tax=Aspergillus minisclerotigenes TaxID=656917 RepID=A0A5N6JL72_9EURO|nr:hypothetical protein BDV30DRAFT_203930 [Aspergillus minisclerotigenes]
MKDYVQHKNQPIVMLPWPPQPTEHNLLHTVEPDVRPFPALSSSPAGASIRREAPPSEAENIEVRLMLDNCLISRSLISKDKYIVLSLSVLVFGNIIRSGLWRDRSLLSGEDLNRFKIIRR